MAHEENEYVFVLTQKLAPPSPTAALKTSGASIADDESLVAVTPQSSPSSLSSSLPVVSGGHEQGAQEEEDGDAHRDEERSDSDDSAEVEVDALPMAMPFLPALDASTEITLHEGYSAAVEGAQRHLDSRLLAYSQYQQMARPDAVLLTPRRAKTDKFVLTDMPAVVDRPVTVCMGWRRVSGVDASSRELLRELEEEGVSYEPHDIAYSVKYLAPVAPFGDCLFLSMEQLLLYTEECEPLAPQGIREVATRYFLAHYESCTPEEKEKIDTAIKNLYHPSLQGGWGVSPIQTRRYVAPLADKDMLVAKCVQLQERGYSWGRAAEMVYSQLAQPVVDARSYCDYMRVGSGGGNAHFLVGLNYSRSGLVSVDNDPENRRVAWGDDFVLEALATAYQRDLFVVLVGCGKMFFLPHRPRGDAALDDRARSKGHAPWFLLMRLTGSDRGGDHYEPMLCERLRGDGSPEFGTIGD